MFKLIQKSRKVESAPSTFVFFLLGEFLFVYSQEAVYSLCVSQIADDLEFVPLHTRYIISIYVFFGTLNGILLAFLSDLYLNKYFVVVFGHLFSTSSMLFSALLCAKVLPEQKLGVELLTISLFIFASLSVIRYAYLAEKIDQSQLYIVSTLRIFTICVIRSLSLLNHYLFYIASGVTMTLANLIYIVDLLFLRYTFSPRKMTIRKESTIEDSVKTKIVENFFMCMRKITIFVVFLPFTTYGFCSQLLHVSIQEQLNNVSYENDLIYFPYNVINPILVLMLLIPINIIIQKIKKKVNNLWFIHAGIVIISVSLLMVCFAQKECEKSKRFPGYGFSRLNIYNGLRLNLSIKSDLFIAEMPKCENYAEVFEIKGDHEVFIQYIIRNETFFHKIELLEAQFSSYIFQYMEVKKLSFDPLYYSNGGYNIPGYPIVSIIIPKRYMIGEISFHKPENQLDDFDVKKTKLKKLVMFGEREFINVPPGKYILKFSGNGRLYFTNETSLKVGGVYSVVINHCKIDVQSSVDSCSYGIYSLLVYFAAFLHCLAEAISLVPIYLFLCEEFKGKYKYTSFSYVYWAYTTGHGAQIWKTWYMNYDFKSLYIYSLQHIIFVAIFIVLSTLYNAKKTEA